MNSRVPNCNPFTLCITFNISPTQLSKAKNLIQLFKNAHLQDKILAKLADAGTDGLGHTYSKFIKQLVDYYIQYSAESAMGYLRDRS